MTEKDQSLSKRSIDTAGRIVIPKEIRNDLKIEINDVIGFYVNDNKEIIMKKIEPTCLFCSTKENVVTFNGKFVCKECIATMKENFLKEK